MTDPQKGEEVQTVPNPFEQPSATDFVIVRRNNMLCLSWEIENWVPRTPLQLTVEPDPGSGKKPIPLGSDTHTRDDGHGAFVKLEMPLLGTFTYTLLIKKPQGDETRSFQVRVMDLHYRSFTATSAEGVVGQPFKLSWEIEAAEGCRFQLETTLPDGSQLRTDIAVDKSGKGSTDFNPTVPGEHTFRLFSFDPHLKLGQPVEKSPVVTVKVKKPKPLWWEVLPVRVAQSAKGHQDSTVILKRDAKGIAPTMTYKPTGFELSHPKGSPAPQDEIDTAVELITKARARIPKRLFHLDANTKRGNLYMPRGQGPKNAIGKDTSPEFQESEQLRATEVKGPTGAVKDQPGHDPGTEQQWAFLEALFPAEGQPTTVTAASVDEFVTIGVGFASSGHIAQRVLKSIIDNKPSQVAERMRAAGMFIELIAHKHEFIAVDVDKKWVLHGTDADHYIACNIELLSVIANIGIGALGDIGDVKATGPALETDPAVKKAQILAMLDAQFAAFKVAAAPDEDLMRPLSEGWVLIAHARHAGNFGGWKGDGATSIEEVADNIWKKLKHDVGTPGKNTGPLTVLRKARAICLAFPKAIAVIRAHSNTEVDGYDFDNDKPLDERKGVTWN